MLILDIVYCLGILYYNQGKLALAKQIYEQALRGYEIALGLEYTLILNIVHNLGILYRN